jgi:hypothetical protein
MDRPAARARGKDDDAPRERAATGSSSVSREGRAARPQAGRVEARMRPRAGGLSLPSSPGAVRSRPDAILQNA